MATEKYANAVTPSSPSTPQTTLNGAINAVVTSLTVAATPAALVDPQFHIVIDDEILLVTGVSSNTWTVTRGVEGSTAASHLTGASVYVMLTAASLLRCPRSMTATGDLEYLDSSGAPARLAAGADGTYLRYASGLPTAAALLATDLTALPGSTTQVLFNDAGALGADAGLTFDKATGILTLGTLALYGGTLRAPSGADSAGDLNLGGGNGGTGAGGGVYVQAGSGATSGGTVGVEGGEGTDGSNGGGVNILGGTGQVGGSITIAPGQGTDSSGSVNFNLAGSTPGRVVFNDNTFSEIGHIANDGSLVMTGSITASDFIVSGSRFAPDTVTGHTASLAAYDVDGAAYVDFITVTNGNVPTCVVKATDFKASNGDSGITKVLNLGVLGTLTIKQGIITASTIAEV